MKVSLLLLSTTFLTITSIFSQTTTAFRVNYNQALFDLPGNAVESLTSDQYVFAGTNMTFLPIYGTITEVDNTGTLVWSKRYYDGSLGFQINDIKKDATLNEYYLCGGSESNAGVFLRVDASGNLVVSKKFSISEADGAYLNRVQKTSDGGYIAVGYVTGYDPDGAGSEIDFAPITYTDANGDSQTDQIASPLIVKFDASGNHSWHRVFRYYTGASLNPATERIYNDASFNDVIETADGYIAVGQYDVNQHRSATNSDGDDATPTDALVIKTDFSGNITFHKQYDAVSSNTSQTSKSLAAINKTSAGVPIAAGSDNGREWIIKFAGTGGWSSTYSRLWTYSSFFGTPDPADISQIYEVSGSTDLVTMSMYVKPLSFVFANALHRVSANAQTNVWGKYYTFSLATLLPRGSQTSDGGYLMSSMTTGAADYDYHIIKTDPTGTTPSSCAQVSFTPSAAAGVTTTADPYYNSWSGTVGSQSLTVTVAAVTPTSSIQCSFTPCTTPSITTQPSNATVCSTGTATTTVSSSAGPYQWQYNNGGTWQNVSNGTPTGFSFASGTSSSLDITTTNATAGSYQFQVIVGSSGCTVTSSTITITVPGATQGSPTGTQCSGTALNFNATPSSGATYAWTVSSPVGTSASPTSGSTSSFTTTPTNTTSAAANYTINVDITSNGVTCSQSFPVTINPTPTDPISGSITQPTCAAPTGSVDLSNLPGSGSWTITASPGGATQTGTGTTATFTGLTPSTTYTFTVSNSFSCTSGATSNVVINAIPSGPFSPTIGTITQPTCASATGSVDLSNLPASGSWTITASPSGATQTGTGTSATFSTLSPNTYTFTVTDNNGCTSVSSLNATINAAPTVPAAPIVGAVTDPDCTTPTGSVALSGLPSSGSWTVTASPSGATTTGTGATTTFSGLVAGTYSFTVINSDGCTSSASSTNATITAAPSTPATPVTGTVTQPDCSTTTGSIQLTGLPATGTWTVTETPGGATYAGSGTTTVINIAAAGTYTYSVTNNAGCNSAASSPGVTINAAPTVPTAPVVGSVTDPDCTTPTGSVALSGLPASGSWTVTASPSGLTTTGTGATTTFSGLAAGTYTFTVINSDGCTSSASSTNATITAAPSTPATPVTGTVTQPDCSTTTGSIQLTGLPATGTWTVTETPGGATYAGSGTTTVINIAAAGTYTYSVTNNAGCNSAASSPGVTINAAPTVPAAPVVGTVTDPDCTTPTGSVALSGLPASGSWTVTASPGGATTTGTGATTTFAGLAAGTYSFTVINSDGCTSSASSTNATINSFGATPSAPVTGTVTQPSCTDPNGSIELTSLPSTGTWTVTESPGGATYTGSGTTTVIAISSAGTYTYSVTNDAGCNSAASSPGVTINAAPTVPAAPIVGAVTNPDCTTPTGSVAISGLPASGSWTVTASPSGLTITGTGATTTFSGLAAGTYSFTIINSDGCTSSASSTNATITAAPNGPSVSVASQTDVSCNGDSDGSAALNVSGGTSPYTYSWSSGAGNAASVSGLAPGNYTVTVTDDAGCTTTVSVSIGEPSPVTPNSSSVDIDCASGTLGSVSTAVSGGTGPYTYVWTPGGETTSSLNALQPGNYTVTVTDANGCTASQTSAITTSGSLAINATPNYAEITSGESVVLNVTGGDIYSWTPATDLSCSDCSNLTASPTSSTEYIVSATNANGCAGQDTVYIKVSIECGEYFIPTAFSPNESGPASNDQLCVFGVPACVSELDFTIYNRWGEIVFQTTDITKCWDGKYKDKLMDSGIFVYKLYVKLVDGTIIEQSGNTTLVR